MPASAPHSGDETVAQPAKGQVIDLASRRRPATERPAADQQTPAPVEYLESPALIARFEEQTGGGADAAAQAAALTAIWEETLQRHGTTLTDPAAAVAATAIAELMEQMLYAGVTIRMGDLTRGIAPNPDDGIDRTGAQMVLDLVHGLRGAAATLGPAPRRDQAGQ